jgi:hypothetical protein
MGQPPILILRLISSQEEVAVSLTSQLALTNKQYVRKLQRETKILAASTFTNPDGNHPN